MKVNLLGKVVNLYFLTSTDDRQKELADLVDSYGLTLIEVNSTTSGDHLHILEEKTENPDVNNLLGFIAREQNPLWSAVFGDDPDGEPAVVFMEMKVPTA